MPNYKQIGVVAIGSDGHIHTGHAHTAGAKVYTSEAVARGAVKNQIRYDDATRKVVPVPFSFKPVFILED